MLDTPRSTLPLTFTLGNPCKPYTHTQQVIQHSNDNKRWDTLVDHTTVYSPLHYSLPYYITAQNHRTSLRFSRTPTPGSYNAKRRRITGVSSRGIFRIRMRHTPHHGVRNATTLGRCPVPVGIAAPVLSSSSSRSQSKLYKSKLPRALSTRAYHASRSRQLVVSVCLAKSLHFLSLAESTVEKWREQHLASWDLRSHLKRRRIMEGAAWIYWGFA